VTAIQTPRLLLRPWQEADLASLVLLANNRKIWLNLRDSFPHPYTAEHAQAWISNPRPFNWAVTLEAKPIGGIGVHPFEDVYRRCAELGYWLGEPFWGRGFATEAVTAVCDWTLAQGSWERLQAGVFSGNLASMRVLEKCGFVLEARHTRAIWKDGSLLDEWLYVRFKKDQSG